MEEIRLNHLVEKRDGGEISSPIALQQNLPQDYKAKLIVSSGNSSTDHQKSLIPILEELNIILMGKEEEIRELKRSQSLLLQESKRLSSLLDNARAQLTQYYNRVIDLEGRALSGPSALASDVEPNPSLQTSVSFTAVSTTTKIKLSRASVTRESVLSMAELSESIDTATSPLGIPSPTPDPTSNPSIDSSNPLCCQDRIAVLQDKYDTMKMLYCQLKASLQTSSVQ